MDQYADDVASLLDWLEIDQAVIGGLSMGGYIAMAMWRRHADRIRGLVLCDPRATADSVSTRAARDELLALAYASGASAVAARQLSGLTGASTKARQPDVVTMLQAMMARQSVAGIVGALEALRERPDSMATMATITVPTLVIVGDEDVLTPAPDARAIIAQLPVATRALLATIPLAGHVTCLERPAAVTHALAEFLASIPLDVD